MKHHLILDRFIKNGDKINYLDIGCGCGSDAIFMAEHGCAVTAIDSNGDKINKLKKTAKEKKLINLNLICKDICSYEIEAVKYNLISLFNVAQFLNKTDVQNLLNKITKNLKTDGSIIIHSFLEDGKHNEPNVLYYFKTQELLNFFISNKYLIKYYFEGEIIDKETGGGTHTHSVVQIVSQKV